HADECEMVLAQRDLREGRTASARHGREPDLDEKLVGCECGPEGADEELGRLERPLARRSPNDQVAVERGDERGKLGGRVGEGEASPDRSPGPGREMADEADRFTEER